MTNVLLYWNHICVLHNQEKAFLSRLAESLIAEEIALTVRYFGPKPLQSQTALRPALKLRFWIEFGVTRGYRPTPFFASRRF